MKTKCVIPLLLYFVPNNCISMTAVSQAAARADKTNDVFYTRVRPRNNNKIIMVLSYFDHSKHQGVLADSLTADAFGTLDFRPLEQSLCRMAMSSQPIWKRHRGILGFVMGAAAGTALGVSLTMSNLNKWKERKEQESQN